MDLKVNYEKLNSVLSRFGLTFDDIAHEFCEARPRRKMWDTRKEVSPHLFKPIVRKVYPFEIANGSYTDNTPSLKDWFEYDFRNENIMSYLGDPRVVSAMQKDANVEFISEDGKLFLYDDGNHRLFNYLLLYLMESKGADTDEEIRAIEEKLAIEKPVHYKHDKDAVWAMRDREDKKREQFSSFQKCYIERHSALNGGFGDYVEYKPDEGVYDIVINGARRSGIREKELEYKIRTEPDFPEGMMLWENDGQYYVMCHNRVVKTRNKEVFKEYYKRCLTGKISLQKPENADKYIIEYDYDENTYGVYVEYVSVHNDLSGSFESRFSKPYTSYIKNRSQLFHKMKSEDVTKVLASCKTSLYSMVYIPERHYKNLSEKECKALVDELEKEISVRKKLEEGLESNE